MAAECLAAIHICRLRVTRLDDTGAPVAGPNNVYVTDKVMQLGVTPTIEAGQDRTLTGGCDCIIATYRGPDKLKRFDLELDIGVLEPGLLEMLLGGDIILDGTDPIGLWWSDQAFDCSNPQPSLCIEAWQTAWDGGGPAADFPNVHWVWPLTHWQVGAHTLTNDFLQPKVTGFSLANSAWGTGIYHDLPLGAGSVGPLGGWFYDTEDLPTATCGYQSHAIT